MYTPGEEYLGFQYLLNDFNHLFDEEPVYHRIPLNENVYQIDLNTREIAAPEFLSVAQDHNSEVIWFKVDRFYDDFDLYNCACLIQYTNALKEDCLSYSVPKVLDDNNHNELYIPWLIAGPATKAAGSVTFSFQFFKLSEDGQRVLYSVNTKSATSKVLHGLKINPVEFLYSSSGDKLLDEDMPADWWDDPSLTAAQAGFLKDYHQMVEKLTKLDREYEIYWLKT